VIVAATVAALLLALATLVARITGRRAQRALQALEPPAPAAPVPQAAARRLRRVTAARDLAAVRQAASGGPEVVVVEAAIEHASDRFRLRASGPGADVLAGEEVATAPVDALAAQARTDEASRAHALLCDRLVAHGWEPCGRGPAWYAHRFRRVVALRS
jgi:hypothetical protein